MDWNEMSLTQIVCGFAKLEAQEHAAHEDVEAYYAPVECHDLINRQSTNRIQNFEKACGMTFDRMLDELGQRVSNPHRVFDTVVGRFYAEYTFHLR